MLRYPKHPNLDASFDEITPEAQQRAILLDWDANALDASMGWCHLLIGGPRWPDLPSIRFAADAPSLELDVEGRHGLLFA